MGRTFPPIPPESSAELPSLSPALVLWSPGDTRALLSFALCGYLAGLMSGVWSFKTQPEAV